MASVLQSASRESLAGATQKLDAQVDNESPHVLTKLGNELFAVLRLLSSEPALRRSLTDPAVPPHVRTALADRLLKGKVDRHALDVVSDLVSSRWSRSLDITEALETLGRRALLGVAEKEGRIEEVEDELFRFGRILDREPQLSGLLGDRAQPAAGRVELLRKVLGRKVSPVTANLLEQTVDSPQSVPLDRAAEELSELAAARKDRYVAHVRTSVRLSAEQEQRLTDQLSNLYGRAISLQVELDPSLIGGLVVRVGDEVIDGSVSSKLAAARRGLPS